MSGASREYNLISGNIFRVLSTELLDRPCEVYMSDMRVKVSAQGMYTYPDVTVMCGDPQFEDTQVDTLLNPTLIIEVLSPSTGAYDRWAKFDNYRQLPSVQEYVLVAQDRPLVEQFIREGERWVRIATIDPAAVVRLPSIDCDLPMAEVYRKVVFPADPVAPGPEPGRAAAE